MLGAGRYVVADARTEPPPATDLAGIVVTGSAASANDADAWVTRSADFLKRAVDAAAPMYGVCFGHQHLARTFGGRVGHNPAGWELGTVGVTLTEEGKRDPLFAGFPATFPVQQSHGEVVAELPPGALTLAETPQTAFPGVRLGRCDLGYAVPSRIHARSRARLDRSAGGQTPGRLLSGVAGRRSAAPGLAWQTCAVHDWSTALSRQLCGDCSGTRARRKLG